jgi:hypothetical protein
MADLLQVPLDHGEPTMSKAIIELHLGQPPVTLWTVPLNRQGALGYVAICMCGQASQPAFLISTVMNEIGRHGATHRRMTPQEVLRKVAFEPYPQSPRREVLSA